MESVSFLVSRLCGTKLSPGGKEQPTWKSRFTSQMAAILKQGEAGVPLADLPREHSTSEATYFQ